jgi:hypothetical protein
MLLVTQKVYSLSPICYWSHKRYILCVRYAIGHTQGMFWNALVRKDASPEGRSPRALPALCGRACGIEPSGDSSEGTSNFRQEVEVEVEEGEAVMGKRSGEAVGDWDCANQ